MSVIPAESFLLIIGAMKCGTTSLFSHLSSHPEICPSRIKEPEFFSENQGHAVALEKYEDLWDFNPGRHRYAMEASTGYTKFPLEKGVVERIQRHGIKPRFIYIVRDPFERIESHFNYMIKHGGSQNCALTDDPFINTSDYYLQLQQYKELFPVSSFLVLDFDGLKTSPQDVMSRVCRFLEIDDFCPEEFAAANRTAPVSKLEYLVRRSPLYWLADYLPDGLNRGIRDILCRLSPEIEQKRLSVADREYVYEKLKLNMGKFSQEYGIDVTRWGF